MTLLATENIDVAYGDFQVLWDVSAHVDEGEIVALLGPNGAGKSTLMNTVSGLLRPRQGRVVFNGRRIDTLPAHQVVGEGIAHVLER
ncbi:MAG TPA: ATP-binding cassette domain-containing protein, partial [Candidatus Acidoferrum sp.]|nr:ATP-binding cassette domain-containing protein [Candidatus Acidoferrum sp.]